MLDTIRSRLAMTFTMLSAGLLVLMLGLTGWLAYSMLNELRPRIQDAFETTQRLNEKNILLNSASYLSERLLPYLQTLDRAGLDREIGLIRDWLPVHTFVVADPDKRILTSGDPDTELSGEPLQIADDLLPRQPRLMSLGGKSELSFIVGVGDEIAGYAVVTLSSVALQTSLEMLDGEVTSLWESASRSLLLGAGAVFGLIIAVAALLVWRLSRALTRPISEMIRAAEAYAEGNLDIALPVRSKDELGHLARALNTMAKELKVSHRRLRHMANYDTLTGLPNRHLFQDRLRQSIHAAERSGDQIALLFLDLDGFKAINDSLGHGLGDEVLKLVAERLRATVRASDTVARLGGDEFTIIAAGLKTPDDVATLASKLLTEIELPYPIQEHRLNLTASIGITLYPRDGTAPETLLRNADGAMYLAKHGGKNAYCFFTAGSDGDAVAAIGLEHALIQAIARRDFELHYQPQVRTASGALIAGETLLRWRNSDSVIQPGDFVPLLEDSGLITELTEWILGEACQQLARWRESLLAEFRITVNLSARQLEQPDLAERIARILAATGTPAHALEIEISEGSLHHQDQTGVADRLQALGVGIAIDDFGKGYSSLVSLQRVHVSTLKIDRDFVANILIDPEAAKITAAVIALAQQLEIRTVAKGVENIEQLRAVRQQGCDMVQGFLISRPLPPDDFLDWAVQHLAGLPQIGIWDDHQGAWPVAAAQH